MGQGNDFYRRPENFLSDIVQREAVGPDESGFLLRAVVLAVDVQGGLLQNPDGAGSMSGVDIHNQPVKFNATVGPLNPRGSVKARLLTDGLDRLANDQETRVFWPLFSTDQISLPISPGEHVYVAWEGEGTDHGVWISRVSGHDSANVFHGRETYRVSATSQQSAMSSFEEPAADYSKDEAHASQAPADGHIMKFFKDEDVS